MGVVFLVCVPTEKHEKVLKNGKKDFSMIFSPENLLNSKHLLGILNTNVIAAAKNYNLPVVQKNDLNVPSPTDENAILRMEVELRDKHQPAKKQGRNKARLDLNVPNVDVPMEKVCVR